MRLVLWIFLSGALLVTPKKQPMTKQQKTTKKPPSLPPPPPLNHTATFRVPLHAQTGSHHVYLWIGQPPQLQTLIVDTGSRLTATTCEPCSDCGNRKKHPHYKPSSTLQEIGCRECQWTNVSKCYRMRDQCRIEQKYTEGSSWTAHEVNDIVFLGDSEHVEEYIGRTIPFTFGCQSDVKGLFRQQYANGIMGLERSEFSIVSKLAQEKVIGRDSFSLCHTPTDGFLGLGGPLRDHHREPMKYTPLIAEEGGWYAVHVQQVYMGGHCVSCPRHEGGKNPIHTFQEGRGTILDSGTTDTYFPFDIAPQFEERWEELTGLSFAQRNQKYTYNAFLRLPEITIELANNVTLRMQPKYYMEGALEAPIPWKGERELIHRVYVDESSGAVIGLNALMDYDVYFDAQDGQVGVAPADCAKPIQPVLPT